MEPVVQAATIAEARVLLGIDDSGIAAEAAARAAADAAEQAARIAADKRHCRTRSTREIAARIAADDAIRATRSGPGNLRAGQGATTDTIRLRARHVRSAVHDLGYGDRGDRHRAACADDDAMRGRRAEPQRLRCVPGDGIQLQPGNRRHHLHRRHVIVLRLAGSRHLMSSTPLSTGFPSAPFVDLATGNVTDIWRRYLLTLDARTGGRIGTDAGSLEAQLAAEKAARIADDAAETTARIAADNAEAATRGTADHARDRRRASRATMPSGRRGSPLMPRSSPACTSTRRSPRAMCRRCWSAPWMAARSWWRSPDGIQRPHPRLPGRTGWQRPGRQRRPSGRACWRCTGPPTRSVAVGLDRLGVGGRRSAARHVTSWSGWTELALLDRLAPPALAGPAGPTGPAGPAATAASIAALDFSILPTSDPGSGKLWLNGGVLQVGP